MASTGHGVDRHFFGLQMILGNHGDSDASAPRLFSHPIFQESKTWRVSSSTVPHAPGFGPVVSNGVGIAYEILPESCVFTCTARTERGYADHVCHYLEESLLELRDLITVNNPVSKL